MSEQECGGHAFPTHFDQDNPGMNLRDYFAGQVIIGLFANPRYYGEDKARLAFDIADEMVAARNEAVPR